MAKIMVIDDEIEACEALQEYLIFKGHSVETAYNGNIALEKMKADIPDIVLLDIIIPGMSGQEILENINKKYPETKVIMVTVVNNEEEVLRSFELGACDYITKPVNFNHLDSVLNIQLNGI